MRGVLLAVTVGVALTGCGRGLVTQNAAPAQPVASRAESDDAEKGRSQVHARPIVLEAASPVQLVGPEPAGAMAAHGLPDLTGLKILLTPAGKLALVTADGKRLVARTHVEANKVMFGVDLADGANISGVLHVQRQLPIVAALILTDAEGHISAGRQEFVPAGARADRDKGEGREEGETIGEAGTPGKESDKETPADREAPTNKLREGGIAGMSLDDAFSGTVEERRPGGLPR